MPLEVNSILTAVAALIVVLAMIWLAARTARLGGIARRSTKGGLLTVQDVLVLDTRRRLHLIVCDGRRVLLLTGGGQDIVVGWVEREAPQ